MVHHTWHSGSCCGDASRDPDCPLPWHCPCQDTGHGGSLGMKTPDERGLTCRVRSAVGRNLEPSWSLRVHWNSSFKRSSLNYALHATCWFSLDVSCSQGTKRASPCLMTCAEEAWAE